MVEPCGPDDTNCFTAVLEVSDEGISLYTNTTLINFVGAGVSASSSTGGVITVTIPGGTGSSSGSDTEIQFNDGGSFGGDAGLTYNKTSDRLTTTYASTTAFSTVGFVGTNGIFTGTLVSNGQTTLGNASTSALTVSGNASLGMVISGVWNGTAIGDAYITKSGDWTGTLDGEEGAYYLARVNQTGTQLAATISDFTTTTRGLLSASAVGLTYSTTTGDIALSSGYLIPLVASSSEWSRAYASTSAITATGPLQYSPTSGMFSLTQASGVQDGYISSADWTTFLGKIASSSLDTSGEVSALITDETGTGSLVFSTSSLLATPTITGSLTMSGNASNILLSSNYLSGDGDDEGVFVSSTGNVGIGTSTPEQRFHIYGAGQQQVTVESSNASNAYQTFKNSSREWLIGNSADNSDSFLIHDITAGLTRVLVDSSGNVGIGTTSPSANLHIESASTTGAQFNLSSSDAGGKEWKLLSSASGNSEGAGKLSFIENGSRVLTMSNGNVGIGTTSPGSLLQIAANDSTGKQLYLTGANGNRRLELGYNTTSDYGRIQAVYNGVGVRNLILNDLGGNVGIGTTTPGTKLDINGVLRVASTTFVAPTVGSGIELSFRGDGKGYITSFDRGAAAYKDLNIGSAAFGINTDSSGINNFVINTNGNVGIGTTSPVAMLSVSSTGLSGLISSTAADHFRVHALGNTYGGGATPLVVSVDRDATTEFSFIKGVSDWNGDQGGQSTRFEIKGDGGGYFLGNVGIGEATPLTRLHVVGQERIVDVAGDGLSLQFNDAGTAIGIPTGNTLAFTTSGIERMRVDNNGNVGIGTTSPLSPLQLGRVFALQQDINSGYIGTNFGSGTAGNYLVTGNYAVQQMFDSATGNIIFKNAATGTSGSPITFTQRMIIGPDGNVGIGSSALAGARLNLVGSLVDSGTAETMQISSSWPSASVTTAGYLIDQYFGLTGSATVPRVSGFFSNGGSLGSATLTEFNAFDANQLPNGGILTNAYAFRGRYASGANRYNLYMDGTADNYFAGNVGIGTASPGQELEVIGDISLGRFSGSNFTRSIGINAQTGGLGSGSTYINFSEESASTGSMKGGNIDFYTHEYGVAAGVAKMRIQANGNVGIGTTSPSVNLDVQGTGNTNLRVLRNGAGASDIWVSAQSGIGYIGSITNNVPLGFLTNNTERMRIDTSGNVGIGTTTPTAQLSTTGSVRFATFGAGTLQTDALGNLSVSSDERLKNIKEPFTKGVDALRGIEPITYNWKKSSGFDTTTLYTGFSAQNIQAFIPEAIDVDPKGFLTLSDRPILATIINATKEQQVTIDGILTASSSVTTLTEGETFWTRLTILVNGFVDGVLTLAGIHTDEVITNELCVGTTCVDEETFLQMVNEVRDDNSVTDTPQDTPLIEDAPTDDTVEEDSEVSNETPDTIEEGVGTPEQAEASSDSSEAVAESA